MAVPLRMNALGEDVARTVGEIFRTMLGLEVTTTQAPWPPDEELLSGAIYYAGSWKGAVLVECTPQQAFLFTGRLMGSERPATVNEDVRDAMGELTNMVAGNLKPLLPHGVYLSMPSVVEGSDYSLWICGGNRVSRLTFASPAGVFWVTLVEMLGPAAPAGDPA